MANDLLTGQAVEAEVREEKRRNATEAERIQKCDPCEGEWPNCDCGGNEEVEPPRPMSEDYVVRQVDEAVGVRPGSVNTTYLNQLKERKRMSMSVDLRMEQSKKKYENKEDRLQRLLSMLPPAPTDKKVADLDKEDDELVNGESLAKAARNVTGDEMASVVDQAAHNVDVDNARVSGDVNKRVAEMTAEVGGCDDCKELVDKEAEEEEEAAEAAATGTASGDENGDDTASARAQKSQAKPVLGVPKGDVATGSVLPKPVPKGAAAIAERVTTLKVEDKDGISSPRAQLLRAGRKAKMQFAADAAKEAVRLSYKGRSFGPHQALTYPFAG